MMIKEVNICHFFWSCGVMHYPPEHLVELKTLILTTIEQNYIFHKISSPTQIDKLLHLQCICPFLASLDTSIDS